MLHTTLFGPKMLEDGRLAKDNITHRSRILVGLRKVVIYKTSNLFMHMLDYLNGV